MSSEETGWGDGSQRLAVLLAMAMFVLVVDTSLMNVSIASVVEDLDTTVSDVQGAIALEALVSAAFILVGEQGGRSDRAQARVRARPARLRDRRPGHGARPGRHGDHRVLGDHRRARRVAAAAGDAIAHPRQLRGRRRRRKAYALVGAAAAIAAAVGPLIGGFLTTILSWRVGFLLEVVVIAVVLSGLKLIRDVPYTGPREVDYVGAGLSAVGMGGVVIGVLVWQEGGEFVGVLIAIGAVALGSLVRWLKRRKRDGKPALLDPDLFKLDLFRLGVSSQMLQNIALGGHDDRAPDLPPDGPGVQRARRPA